MIGLRLRPLLVVGLVAVPAIGVVAYQGFEEKARAESEARRSLLGFAELVAVNQGVLVNQTRTLVGALAREAVVQDFRDPACDDALAVVLARNPHYTGFGVLDTNGTLWCVSQPITGTPNHSALPHFQRAMATGEFAVGDFAIGSISGKATLAMAMPVRDPGGRIKGVVVAALSLDWANNVLAQLALPEGSAASLVDASGTIVARFPQPQEFTGQPFPVAADLQAAMAQGEAILTAEGVDGVQRVYAFVPLFPGAPGRAEFVAVGTPPGAIYGGITERMWTNLAVLSVVSGGAGLGAWVLAARTVATLDRSAHDLRVANQELKRDRQRLAGLGHLFDNSNDLFAVADFDGMFLELNPAWEHTLGWWLEDLKGKPFLDFVHADDRGKTSAVAADLATGGRTKQFSNRYLAKDGSYRWLTWSAVGVPATRRIYAVARDETERISMERKVQESEANLRATHKQLEARNQLLTVTNQELERFADALAHDLRAPLGSMSILAEMVQEEIGTGAAPELQKHLVALRDSARQSQALLRSVLEYARAGKDKGDKVPTDLGGLAKEAVAAIQGPVEQAQAKVDVGDLPTLPADPDSMRRLFQNLVENAIKYRSAEPPLIRITAEKGDGLWALAVEDNGIGIPKEKLEKVFEPFNRVRTQSSATSFGLGLSLCRRIVNNHDGTIWAESEGKGTRIRIVLPDTDGKA